MKYYTEDESTIAWMRNPDAYESIADTVRKIVDAGRWDDFLELHADDEGAIDCDSLYDYLQHESSEALLDVGLHENEATATVKDVLDAWEEENEGEKVNRDETGGAKGLALYDYGSGICLDFETVDQDGEIDTVSLDAREVFGLLQDRVECANNATEGAWSGTDESDVFEMWRGR